MRGSLGPLQEGAFSFVNCSLTTLPAATGSLVGRTRSITNGNTVLITCLVSDNISGWASDALPTNNYRNWYYACSNLTATTQITLNNGLQLVGTDPNVTNASSSTLWLGGWVPQLSPNITSQPVDQSVNGGQTATLSVGATGIPDPSFQWLKNGTNLPGATNPTLSIPNARAGDTASYSVIVSNTAGTVTSSTATVTVGNTAPALAPVSDQTLNVGVTLALTNSATDPDVPPQSLTFGLLSGPVGAALDASGVFTWRPQVSQGGSSNFVSVVVTDDGSPNLSATNTFSVFVNPVTQPDIASPGIAGGQFSLTVNGQAGPDYAVQASTNLLDTNSWTTVFRTNSPGAQFQWADPDTTASPFKFYRIIVGPPLP